MAGSDPVLQPGDDVGFLELEEEATKIEQRALRRSRTSLQTEIALVEQTRTMVDSNVGMLDLEAPDAVRLAFGPAQTQLAPGLDGRARRPDVAPQAQPDEQQIAELQRHFLPRA